MTEEKDSADGYWALLHVSGALTRTIIAVSKMKGSNRVENLRKAQKRYFRLKIAELQLANNSAFVIRTCSSLVPGPHLSARFLSGVSHVPRLHQTVNFKSPEPPSITAISRRCKIQREVPLEEVGKGRMVI
jgi:hypothetical protein